VDLTLEPDESVDPAALEAAGGAGVKVRIAESGDFTGDAAC
jgi:hypothetical protein